MATESNKENTSFNPQRAEYERLLSKVNNEIINIDKANLYKDFQNFNRFRIPVVDPFATNVGYVFFTKPNLNFSDENIGNSNYLSALCATEYGKSILSSLSVSYDDNFAHCSGNFIKVLSNSVLNFDTKDTVLQTNDIYENFIGYKFNLPSTFIDSITADTVTLNFLEADDLRVLNTLKVWLLYMQNIKRGIFKPNAAYRTTKILDYACSIYFFLCGPDGHSIKYHTKLTGCFPTNIPYSAFSWDINNNPDIKKLSVTFQYQIREDLEPEIINDFMKVSSNVSESQTYRVLKDEFKNNWANSVIIHDGGLYFI